MMGFKKRERERQAAADTISEFFKTVTPALKAIGPHATEAQISELMERYLGTLATIFGSSCERHGVPDEAAVRRAWSAIAPELARLVQLAGDLEEQTKVPDHRK